MNAEQVWQAVLGELQLQLTKSTFDTWVKNTHVLSYEDGTFVIGVHNAYAKDWLENRLLTTIKRTLIGIVGQTVEIKFVVHPRRSRKATPENILLKLEDQGEEIPSSLPRAARSKTQTSHTQRSFASTGLNPGLTFETFVVGNS
ncbi:MAG: DnaA N-terminal domain-containing protein, partial [Anaerolineae bacterium]